MKLLYKYIAILLISILSTSCNTEITLNTSFEPQVFIFGNLTNATEHLKITIQESVSVENTSNEPKPVNNAKIVLYTENSNGESSIVTGEFLKNTGVYQSISVISPTFGNYYWIEVELEDGTTYKSEKEQLKPLVYIDEVSKINGFIRASFKDPKDKRNFYKLEITTSENGIDSGAYMLSNDILFDGNDDAFIEENIGLFKGTVHASLANFSYDTYQFYLNVVIQEDTQSGGDGEGGGLSQLFATHLCI